MEYRERALSWFLAPCSILVSKVHGVRRQVAGFQSGRILPVIISESMACDLQFICVLYFTQSTLYMWPKRRNRTYLFVDHKILRRGRSRTSPRHVNHTSPNARFVWNKWLAWYLKILRVSDHRRRYHEEWLPVSPVELDEIRGMRAVKSAFRAP